MKKTLLLTLALVCAALSNAAEVPLLQNVLGRATQSLNGKWHYIVDVQQRGYYDYRLKPMRHTFGDDAKAKTPQDLVEYNFDTAPTMNIPSDWNTADPKLYFYEGCVWFERKFDFHSTAGKRTLLHFGAINYDAIVYLNGKELGHHEGGFTPFNYDVTDVLKDGENSIVVKVDNTRKQDNVPTLIFDWWNYGGITRDVTLVSLQQNYVEDYTISLDKRNMKQINITVKMREAKADEKVSVSIPELKISKVLTTAADGTASVSLKARPQLWSPESPKLYKVKLIHDGEETDDEVGFRTITTRGQQILLNGKPVFLRGISIHEEKAYTAGRCNSRADADTLLGWAKQLGCNFVRLAHYPHNEYAVREAERMGIMVWSEIPCYWTISWTNEPTYQNAQRQLHDMISRDKNRANVIIWSVANETPHSAERDAFLSRLAKYAHSEDTTRLVSMAMEVTSAQNYVNRLNDNMNKYVDVISFNEYIGWYRDVNDAQKMTWEIPYNKPIIISEMGGGAVAGRHGPETERWTEEFQAKLYRENFAMLDKIKGLVGTSPWILKDFMSPARMLFGVQDFYNRKGLVSDKGQKKMAFDVVKQWYAEKAKMY